MQPIISTVCSDTTSLGGFFHNIENFIINESCLEGEETTRTISSRSFLPNGNAIDWEVARQSFFPTLPHPPSQQLTLAQKHRITRNTNRHIDVHILCNINQKTLSNCPEHHKLTHTVHRVSRNTSKRINWNAYKSKDTYLLPSEYQDLTCTPTHIHIQAMK